MLAYGIASAAWPGRKAEQAPSGSESYRMPIATGMGRAVPEAGGLDYARIDARFNRLMLQDKDNMVGLAVAIVEDGRITFVKGYGETLAGSGDPVTPKTVFRWASLSKGVATATINALADKQRLSLGDPVAKFGTSLRLPGGAENQITLTDLLSHRTGLARNAYDDKLEAGGDPAAIRGALGTLSLKCAPGTCYAYQNLAFDAASEVVRNVTGQSYPAVVTSLFFAPLGMTSASFDRAGLERAASWARPHRHRRALTVNDTYYRVPAAGGVNSSIFDLAKWMRAQMGAVPAVLSPDDLRILHQPRVETLPSHARGPADRALSEASYALGWRDFRYEGHRLIGHRGAVDGYRSLILFDPDRKTGIAMLWNSESGRPVGMQMELFDMLYALPYKDWMEIDAPQPGFDALNAAH